MAGLQISPMKQKSKVIKKTDTIKRLIESASKKPSLPPRSNSAKAKKDKPPPRELNHACTFPQRKDVSEYSKCSADTLRKCYNTVW